MNMEKRQYVRAQVEYPVMVKSSQVLMLGQAKDISPGGAFICCQWPSEPGKVLEMTIRVSPLGPPLKAKGKVIRSRIYCLDDETRCHGISVRFTKISDDDRRCISSLISGYLKSESGRGTFETVPAPNMVRAAI
jgi:hypothetical protein